jgi:hypothetical protein
LDFIQSLEQRTVHERAELYLSGSALPVIVLVH